MRLSRRGNASVEFALTLPIFVIFLGGIIEWGRFSGQQLDVLHAVREGVRAGVGTEFVDSGDTGVSSTDRPEDPKTAAENRTLAVLAESGLTGSYSATATLTDLGSYEALTVEASADYTPLFSLVKITMPSQTNGTFTMMMEDDR